jgi:hypothetical protein
MLEASAPVIPPGVPEGMDVILAAVFPVLEVDAQLERGLRSGHEFLLTDAEQPVEMDQRWNGGLAHAHGADLVGLDELDVEHLAQSLRDRGGDHPSGGAAPCDHDLADGLVLQDASSNDCCAVVGVSDRGVPCCRVPRSARLKEC